MRYLVITPAQRWWEALELWQVRYLVITPVLAVVGGTRAVAGAFPSYHPSPSGGGRHWRCGRCSMCVRCYTHAASAVSGALRDTAPLDVLAPSTSTPLGAHTCYVRAIDQRRKVVCSVLGIRQILLLLLYYYYYYYYSAYLSLPRRAPSPTRGGGSTPRGMRCFTLLSP